MAGWAVLMMKASKILFLISLLLGNCAPPLIFLAFGGLMFPKNKFMPLIGLYFLVIVILIGSYFPVDERRKRMLENCSLVLSAIFYLSLIGMDRQNEISFLGQLPFLLSFGLFLYYKMLRYFNRKTLEK